MLPSTAGGAAMTRVALFGCGWIQDFHARGVLAHPHGELAAVANWRESSARAFAERHGIPRVTTDWEALAADPEIDAAIVATPNALHAPQTIALLRSGKHVLVEKPMATSVAECDAMIATAREAGAFLMVAHCWRFRDEVRAMRARIAAGELGEIVKTRGYGVHAGWGPVERSSTWACTRSTRLGTSSAIPIPSASAPWWGRATRGDATRWTTMGSC
jgi:predicted dehydrogenase